jgi:phosphoglycerate dehydrogenase-like enzyme
MVRELLPGDEIRGGSADRLPPTPVDVLVPAMSRVDTAVIDAAQPRVIQQFGAGLDGVDVGAAQQQGVGVARRRRSCDQCAQSDLYATTNRAPPG